MPVVVIFLKWLIFCGPAVFSGLAPHCVYGFVVLRVIAIEVPLLLDLPQASFKIVELLIEMNWGVHFGTTNGSSPAVILQR